MSRRANQPRAFFDFEHNQQAIRRHLHITLREVQSCTAIPILALARAEAGIEPLADNTRALVSEFLKSRLAEHFRARRAATSEPEPKS